MEAQLMIPALVLFNFVIGLLLIRSERRLEKAFRRIRFLHERLETVEKFNGIGQTYTDVRAKM